MKKNFSLYFFLSHLLILVLVCLSAWLSFQLHQKKSEEQKIVQKYKPTMESLCTELDVDVNIESLEDLLNAFEEITTKPAR